MIHIVDHIRPAVYLHVGRYEIFKLCLGAFLHMINVQEFFLPIDISPKKYYHKITESNQNSATYK